MLRRFAAWSVDSAVVFGLFLLVCWITYFRLGDLLSGKGTQLLTMGPVDLLTSQGDVTGLARGTAMGLWDSTVSIVIQGFALLVLAQLVYQFVALSWRGRTLGKAVSGVQVRPRREGGPVRLRKGQALRRATVTTLSESGLYSVACVLLLLGQFFLSFVCWLAAVAVFLLNALPVLMGRRRRSLGDLAGGTVVVRTRVLRDAVRTVGRVTADQGRRLQSAYADRRAAPSSGREIAEPAAPLQLPPPQAPPYQVPPPQAQPYQVPPPQARPYQAPPGPVPPPGP